MSTLDHAGQSSDDLAPDLLTAQAWLAPEAFEG